jgi:DNA helicase HerA-like ATPase
MTDDILDRDPVAGDESDDEPADQAETTHEDDSPSRGSSSDDEQRGTSQTGGVPETSVPNSVSDLEEGEIGHVLASEEIRISRGDYNVNAFITTGRRDDVRVGDYVQIPYPNADEQLFAVADGLRYEPYTELDDKSDTHNRITEYRELDESEYVLVAELEPIAILDESDDGLERGIVNKIPKPNTPVSLSRDDEYLRTGLNIPHDGAFCGYISVGGDAMEIDGEAFPYYLHNPGIDPATGEIEAGEPAIFRHALVAGSTGKGKTHFTKNLLRQFVDGKRYPIAHHDTGNTLEKRLNVVLLDPENEYWEMRDDNPDLDAERASALRRQGVEVGGIDDLEVFIPEVARTKAPSVGSSRSFGIPFELVASRPQLIMPYQPTEITRGAIENVIRAYFDQVSSGEQPTYEKFISYLDHEEESLKDRFDINDGTWGAVMRRVRDSTYRHVFDQGMTPITEITDELFREGRVTVIPTSHLRGSKEELVVLSVLSLIIENKIDDHDVDEHIKDTPMLVAVDEAHNYFSSPDSLREAYIVGRAREAVKQGRKDKLGLLLITQNPEDIDGDILKQINTNVFLGLRDEVVEKVPSVPAGFKRDIPKFGKGQAVVKAPDVEAVELVGLDVCVTKHGN